MYLCLVDTKARSILMNPTYPSEASETAGWLIGTPCCVSTEGSLPFEVYLPSQCICLSARLVQGRLCLPMNSSVSVKQKAKGGRNRTTFLFLKFPTGLPVSLFFILLCIYLILKCKILLVEHIGSLSSVLSEKGWSGVAKLCVTAPKCL